MIKLIYGFDKRLRRLLGGTSVRNSRALATLKGIWLGLVYPNNTIRIRGISIQFHSPEEYHGRKLINDPNHKRKEIDFLCSLTKIGDVVFDVGANIGLHTMNLSAAVGEKGRVCSFEPDPENLAILKRNICKNHCNNVTLFPYALSNTSGKSTFYKSHSNKGSQGFARNSDTDEQIEVEVRRLDELISVKPDLMKIDVEGAEPQVLGGMAQWPKLIFFEFVPEQLRAFGNDPLLFLQLIECKGYLLYDFDEQRGEINGRKNSLELLNMAETGKSDLNILAQLSVEYEC